MFVVHFLDGVFTCISRFKVRLNYSQALALHWLSWCCLRQRSICVEEGVELLAFGG